jgi:pseudaminic acid cytidylyltransferase
MKRSIAIIPARGGSKRIPKKNIKPFLGKPIIAYSIEAALESGLFEEVMVSTDDEEIAKLASAFGAKVPFVRSAENANDMATTSAVLAEVLDTYSNQGEFFDSACCLYACAPLINAQLLKDAHQRLMQDDFDCVVPLLPFSFPIWRSVTMDDNQQVKMIWPENMNKRSQDLPTAFHDAGQFYFFKTKPFLNSKDLWRGKVGGIQLNEMQAQDIDTMDDWHIAEVKYKLLTYGNEEA